MRTLYLALFATAVLCACGGGGSTAPPPSPKVSVSVSPASARTQLGGQQQFTAAVHNSADQRVLWSVNDIRGGNAAVGTIDAAGLYRAPAVGSAAPGEVTLRAVAAADARASATASVDVFPAHLFAVRVSSSGRGEIYNSVNGATFVPRGNNYVRLAPQTTSGGGAVVFHSTWNVGQYDAAQSEAALAGMATLGYNVVRVWINTCCPGFGVGDTTAGVSRQYAENAADFIRRAQAHGIYVIITADLPFEGGGYHERFYTEGCCDGFDWGFNLWHLSAAGVGQTRAQWHDLVAMLVEVGAPLDGILAYEIAEEFYYHGDQLPLSATSGAITAANGQTYDMAHPADKQRLMDEGLIYWVDQVRAGIREVDPNAIVITGYFAPNFPNPWRDVERLVPSFGAFRSSTTDIVAFSTWPFALGWPQTVENLGFGPVEAKPLIIGEFGTFLTFHPNIADAAALLRQWQVDSCASGISGWQLWTWDTTTSEQVDGPSWWATAGNGEINQALAPAYRRDPCAP